MGRLAGGALARSRRDRRYRSGMQTPSAQPVQAITLRVADSPPELERTREIFRDYAESLVVDLCFQGFEAELATLPGCYGADAGGHLLLVYVNGQLAGCGALRRLDETDYANACEMKRLFVRQPFRGLGLGRLLAQHLLDEARRGGYSSMLLDTLDDMEAARELYASLGFSEIPPYYFNPIGGAHYLKADLT